jgi:hypothetical protein
MFKHGAFLSRLSSLILGCVCESFYFCFLVPLAWKNIKLMLFFFLLFSNDFDVLMLKKKILKKFHFDVFSSKKTIVKNTLHHNFKHTLRGHLELRSKRRYTKFWNLFFLLIFFMILDYFDMLMSKIIFLNEKKTLFWFISK